MLRFVVLPAEHLPRMLLKPQARGLLALLLVIALLLRQGLAVVLLGLLTLALGFAALWGRWALRRVLYERTLSHDRAFVGDQVVLTQRVINRKPLGLPSLRIDDVVPDKLSYGDQRLLPNPQASTKVLRRWTALRAYEAISWTIRIDCTKRGMYTFGPTLLQATDAFGLHVRELAVDGRTRLIVYPQVLRLPQLNLRSQHPVGDRRSPRQLLTDPLRTVGVRDYHHDDPLKAIHWGATARRGALQTRVFEPTTSLQVAIVLNIDTFEHYWEGMRYDLIEHMISTAATVAHEAAEQRLGFGLYANGALADSGQLVRLPPNQSPLQLNLVLEALAKLVLYSVTPFPNFLRKLGPALEWGSTVVLISAVASAEVQTALLRLARRGRRIVWLYAGDAPTPQLPGIEVISLEAAGTSWADQRGRKVTSPVLP